MTKNGKLDEIIDHPMQWQQPQKPGEVKDQEALDLAMIQQSKRT